MESQDFRVSIDLDEKKLGISLRKLIDNSFSLSLQKQAKISRKTSSRSSSQKGSPKSKSTTREQKLLKFQEKVEKFRLTQTKKLIKQGFSFEQARKKAYTQSLMSAKDLRSEEWQSLKKDNKLQKTQSKLDKRNQSAFMKTLQDISRNTKFSRLTFASVVGSAINKTVSGIWGFLKASVKRNASLKQTQVMTTSMYGGKASYDQLKKRTFSDLPYVADDKKDEILKQASVLKGALSDIGEYTPANFEKYIKGVAKLVSVGYDTSQAVSVYESAIREGDFSGFKDITQSFVSDKNTSPLNEEDVRRLALTGVSSEERLTNVDRIDKFLDPLVNDMRDSIANSPEVQMTKTLKQLTDMEDRLVSQALEKAKTLMDEIQNILNEMNKGRSLWSILSEKLTTALTTAFMDAWNSVKGSISNFFSNIKLSDLFSRQNKTNQPKDSSDRV